MLALCRKIFFFVIALQILFFNPAWAGIENRPAARRDALLLREFRNRPVVSRSGDVPLFRGDGHLQKERGPQARGR